LVSAAKALLSLKVGIGFGCMRIGKILSWLGLYGQEEYKVFQQFLKAAVGFPIGNERLRWATDALLAKDAELAKIEVKFRPAILVACVAIISTYG
jgi:hypothetical protein